MPPACSHCVDRVHDQYGVDVSAAMVSHWHEHLAYSRCRRARSGIGEADIFTEQARTHYRIMRCYKTGALRSSCDLGSPIEHAYELLAHGDAGGHTVDGVLECGHVHS